MKISSLLRSPLRNTVKVFKIMASWNMFLNFSFVKRIGLRLCSFCVIYSSLKSETNTEEAHNIPSMVIKINTLHSPLRLLWPLWIYLCKLKYIKSSPLRNYVYSLMYIPLYLSIFQLLYMYVIVEKGWPYDGIKPLFTWCWSHVWNWQFRWPYNQREGHKKWLWKRTRISNGCAH